MQTVSCRPVAWTRHLKQRGAAELSQLFLKASSARSQLSPSFRVPVSCPQRVEHIATAVLTPEGEHKRMEVNGTAALAAQASAVRPPAAADSKALLAMAVATGLFDEQEADALLGGVLRSWFSGTLGDGHQVLAWYSQDSQDPRGWCYFAPDPHADGVWNLWWIGVHPDYHGKGVGVALLTAVEDCLRREEARLLIIETSSMESTERARAFYVRQGYSDCGRIPDFYGQGDDKLIFCKRVS